MLNIKLKLISICLLVSICFLSSYKLILQTYEHRSLFAELENLRLEKDELSFQSNILIEEVKYYKNHISLRKYASENLGMIIPKDKDRVYITRKIDQ
tara:strand:+ start:327 stop:617 length:291 start_codon:yes stop_codon:yes gene_type:complete